MSSLLNFQPSDAYSQNLRRPIVGDMRLGNLLGYFAPISKNIMPYEDSPRLGIQEFNFDFPQVLKDAYSGINKFGQALRGELTQDQMKQLAFDTSLNVAGGGLLGSAVKGAKPIGALGMGGGGVKPLTRDQIDPLRYGGVKGLLTRPLDELDIGYSKDVDLIPQKNINIEDLQGSYLYPLTGDQSATGLLINSIDGNVFQNPVKLEGGANFMRGASQKAEGSAWASDKKIITRISNDVKRLADETGLPVNMIYTAMSKDGVDFATFPASVLAEQIPFAKIFKKDIKSFNDKMKVDIKISGDKYPSAKDFVGVESPNLRKYLETAPPKIRKKFVKLMDTDPFQKAGFPSVAQARYAVTDDALKKSLSGETGLVLARPDLNKLPTDNPIVPHSTYPTQMYGDYIGGLNQKAPREMVFRDFYKKLATQRDKSGNLLNPSMKDYSFRLNLPAQLVDQQLVDTIMNYSLLNR